jgi:hypothetical protein
MEQLFPEGCRRKLTLVGGAAVVCPLVLRAQRASSRIPLPLCRRPRRDAISVCSSVDPRLPGLARRNGAPVSRDQRVDRRTALALDRRERKDQTERHLDGLGDRVVCLGLGPFLHLNNVIASYKGEVDGLKHELAMTKHQLDQLRYGLSPAEILSATKKTDGKHLKQDRTDVREELLRRMRARGRRKKPTASSLLD